MNVNFAIKIAAFVVLICASLNAQEVLKYTEKNSVPYLVITYISNEAQIRNPADSKWREARLGDVLLEKGLLRTSKGSLLKMNIARYSGGSVWLKDASVLVLESHKKDLIFKTSETVLKLLSGKIRIIKEKMNPASKIFVVTPHQVNRISRAADFVVYSGLKYSLCAAFLGEVLSASALGLGSPKWIVEGYMSKTGKDLAPEKPEAANHMIFVEWDALDRKEDLLEKEFGGDTSGGESGSDSGNSPDSSSDNSSGSEESSRRDSGSSRGEKGDDNDEEIKWEKIDPTG